MLDSDPSLIYLDNGNKIESWFYNKVYHREDGPAYQLWMASGFKKTETWWYYGKIHRIDGPAILYWCDDGNLQFEEWYIGNKKIVGERIEEYKVWLTGYNLYNKCIISFNVI